MNELYRFEENELIIPEKIIEGIKDLERKKKLIENKQKSMRESLLEAMEKYGKNKWESPDGTLKVSYTPAVKMDRFDSDKFAEEHHDLYLEYLKEVPRKASLRITIGEKND